MDELGVIRQKNYTQNQKVRDVVLRTLIIDLEPDILECEVKWALESITTNKASGGDGIPAEYFKS